MDSFTILIIVSSIFVIWQFYKYTNQNDDKTPALDTWLVKKFKERKNPNLEDLLTEYINTYDVKIRHEISEDDKLTIARTKLRLLEEYELERLFGDNSKLKDYKFGLEAIVEMRESISKVDQQTEN